MLETLKRIRKDRGTAPAATRSNFTDRTSSAAGAHRVIRSGRTSVASTQSDMYKDTADFDLMRFKSSAAAGAVGPDTDAPRRPSGTLAIPWGTYVLDPLRNIMFFRTSACARRTGAAARVERRRRER